MDRSSRAYLNAVIYLTAVYLQGGSLNIRIAEAESTSGPVLREVSDVSAAAGDSPEALIGSKNPCNPIRGPGGKMIDLVAGPALGKIPNIPGFDNQVVCRLPDTVAEGDSNDVKPSTTLQLPQSLRPVAFFKFEDDVADSSGFSSDSDVSVSGRGSLVYDAGICGQAAVFDGKVKVTVQSFNGFAWGMNFSVSVWFKRTGTWDTLQNIVGNGYSSYGSWEIKVNENQADGRALSCLRFQPDEIKPDGGISGACLYHDSFSTDAVWKHVVMTYDGNHFLAYLNGVKIRSTDICCNRDLTTTETPVTIGDVGPGSVSRHYFHGLIDELRIYNHTLTNSQVRDLYNTTRCT